MFRRLRAPLSRQRYHSPVIDPAIANDPAGSNGPAGEAPGSPGYLAPYWKLAHVTKPASRIIFGDSRQSYLDPNGPNSANPNGSWTFGAVFNSGAQSGDPGRHSAKRWVQGKGDPAYTTLRANYVFVDGHAESLDSESALKAINIPQ
jgi:prepilin-type processing-associated H-X9-DG protein